jgi:hypothetical protein
MHSTVKKGTTRQKKRTPDTLLIRRNVTINRLTTCSVTITG